MAIEYELTLAGETPGDQVAERAFPDPAERPTGTLPLLTVDLKEPRGFTVTVLAGRDGYVDVESDAGMWEWEPESYVSLSFSMDKFADPEWAEANMLTVVHRVLATGPEDAAFALNGDILLLTRFNGELVKHRRDKWWDFYPASNQLIPG